MTTLGIAVWVDLVNLFGLAWLIGLPIAIILDTVGDGYRRR